MAPSPITFGLLLLLAPGSGFSVRAAEAPLHGEAYTPFEWTLAGDPGKLDPFDPDQASLEGVFVSPGGKSVTVDGFWTQDYDEATRKAPLGAPHWCLRFCPTESGRYRFTSTLRLGDRVTSSGPLTLDVSPSDRKGFVQAGSPNGLYFTLSTGGGLYPLGLSVAWTSRNRLLEEYDRYFKEIGDHGGDLTRIWTCEWNLPLEWSRPSDGTPVPPGRYRLDSAALLDGVFASARRHGLRVILTLDTYGELMDEKGPWGEQSWDRNPYNKALGGPCAKPWDLFTNPEARRLYRNRLRYVSARWGAYSELFAVEFFNEVNVPPAWAEEMADHFRSRDPYGHLVSTSVAWPWGVPYDEDELWKLPSISPVMKHFYGATDLADEVRSTSLARAREFHKPFFYEEIGLDPMKDDAAYDTKGAGTHLHNAFWAAATGLSAAAPLSHWKEYVDQKGLYRLLVPLRRFVDAVDWGRQDWTPLDDARQIPNASGGGGALTIALNTDWNAPVTGKVWISADGSVEGRFPAFLKTTSRDGGVRSEVEVYSPRPVTLVLEVVEVSTGGDLRAFVDGKEGPRWSFDPRSNSGDDYLSTRKDAKWNVDIASYARSCRVPLPKGRHRLKIENRGADWVRLGSARVEGLDPPVLARLRGLASDRVIVGWIQDKRNVWWNVYNKGWVPVPVKGLTFPLRIRPGTWKVDWYDTVTGVVTTGAPLRVQGDPIPLSVPEFQGDIAFILTRAEP